MNCDRKGQADGSRAGSRQGLHPWLLNAAPAGAVFPACRGLPLGIGDPEGRPPLARDKAPGRVALLLVVLAVLLAAAGAQAAQASKKAHRKPAARTTAVEPKLEPKAIDILKAASSRLAAAQSTIHKRTFGRVSGESEATILAGAGNVIQTAANKARALEVTLERIVHFQHQVAHLRRVETNPVNSTLAYRVFRLRSTVCNSRSASISVFIPASSPHRTRPDIADHASRPPQVTQWSLTSTRQTSPIPCSARGLSMCSKLLRDRSSR
jgi:hypothetical protein